MKQKRRTFLKTSAAFGLGLPFLGCSTELAESIMKTKYVNNIGLQLWTVRNQLKEDFAGTIKKIAAHGYHQVEGFGIDMLAQLAPVAKDAGLAINSMHIGSTHFTGRWDLAGKEPESFDPIIELASKNGIKHLIVGYLQADERGLDDYKKLAESFNREGEKCAKAGITLGYHNHNFEFANVDGVVPYDMLRKEIDAKNAKFELDVFWASVSGVDPVELMKKMKGQISLLHLKDKKKDTPDSLDTGEVPKDAYKELGNGEVDIKSIVEMAEATGVEHCFVEQDESADPLASIKTSIDWLNTTF